MRYCVGLVFVSLVLQPEKPKKKKKKKEKFAVKLSREIWYSDGIYFFGCFKKAFFVVLSKCKRYKHKLHYHTNMWEKKCANFKPNSIISCFVKTNQVVNSSLRRLYFIFKLPLQLCC